MCMINSSSAKRSKKDVKCYKIVVIQDKENSLYKGVFYDKEYKLDVEYQEGSEEEFISLDSSVKRKGGFHSFMDSHMALLYYTRVANLVPSPTALVECIIPEGSLYCTGEMECNFNGNAISNYFSHKIIVKNVLLPNKRV